jgi:ABC-type nitrate/sulfonate/bicarbonate transport system permease component
VLYSLPLIAIAPLMVIWFGAGLRTKVIIAALAAFFPVLVNTTEALLATNRQALELMQVMGASFVSTSWRVRFPYALPAMFASFTISAPAAVIGATVAEWVGGDRGLGVAILAAMQSYNVPLLWSSILVVSLLSLVAYGVFAVLGRVLFPWHESVSNAGES